jgi:basic amino acid/polyamine antiporter, APA family
MAQLKRALSLWQCIFFGVGSILGAGIYALIGKVAGWAGDMLWLSFLIASLAALFTAFSYAELSAAFPKAGAEYEYAKQAFGKKTGTVLGFIISTNGIISGATVAIGFASYLTQLLPIPALWGSLAIITLIFLVNIIGIQQSSTVNIICTIIEALGLLLVIYAAFPSIGRADYLTLPEKGVNGLLAASALCFFAYIGFEEIVKLAEETKEPETNIPKALFTASIIVMVIYMLVAVCAVSAVPWQRLSASEGPLAYIVSKRIGRTAATVIAVIALFSTSNTVLSNMLGSSRVLLDISREAPTLQRFAYIAPRRKTPIYTLLATFLLMGGFAFIGRIELIALIANLFIFTTFILVNLSVIVLRRKIKDLKRPYRIPLSFGGVPFFPVLGILLVLLLMGYAVYALFAASATN